MNSIKPASNQRLLWADYAKGVGILLVVYGHVLRGLSESGFIKKGFFYYSDNFIYSFHMPLFFILSGIFFYGSFKKNTSGFVFSKLKTLIYPFIIWSILQTLIEVAMNRFTNSKTPVSALLTCLIIPRAQFWFLYALFFATCLNFIFYKINEKYGLAISCLVWLIYFVVRPDLGPFGHVFQYLIFFNVGIAVPLLSNNFKSVIDNRFYTVLVVVLFAAAEYAFFYWGPKSVIDYSLQFVVAGIIGTALIVQLSKAAISRNIFMFFNYLGKESMPIYLVHIIVGSGTRVLLIKILKIHDPVVNVIVATILGLTIPIVIYTFCSKSRYLSWLFKFPDNSRPKQAVLPIS